MVVLNRADILRVSKMSEMLDAMRWAFRAYAAGLAAVPERIHLHLPDGSGTALIMPAYVPGFGAPDSSIPLPATLAAKVFAVIHGNAGLGLPSFQGATTLLDPLTGVCLAVLDAATLTALRTGASCGVATDVLSRRDSSDLAIFGAGPQALSSLDAILLVRQIKRIHVLQRHADAVSDHLRVNGFDLQIVVSIADEMVRSSDIVLSATSATEPLFDARAAKAGTHFSALGSFQPGMQELPPGLVASARVYVDNLGASSSSGDLVRPVELGFLPRDRSFQKVGDVLNGAVQGRTADADMTIYKSVGNAVQDAIAAQVTYQSASRLGIGQVVVW